MRSNGRLQTFLVILLLTVSPQLNADEPAARQPPQIEPVDFIDNPRPNQNEATNQRAVVVSTNGWGYAAFSPDSQFVATVWISDELPLKGAAVVWAVADSKPGIRFEQSGRIDVVAFSPDGKLLAIGPHAPQAGVKLVDVKTGEVAQTLPGPVARTNAMVWSADGQQLALASTADKTIRIWNVVEQKFARALEPEASSLLALGFTKSGRLLAAGVPSNDRDGLVIFDVMNGKIEKTLKGHKELIEAATFSNEALKLTSVGWDATIRIWDIANDLEPVSIKGHKKGLLSVATSADGKRLATSNDREFKLWDGEKKELLADLGVENSGAKFVAMSPDGKWLISISRDGTAHLWDVEKKTEKAQFNQDQRAMVVDVEGDDGKPATAATTVTGDSPEPEAIQSLAYSFDGKWIALAREDGRISVRHAADGKTARELDGFTDVATCVVFSRDSQRIAAGSFDKSIKVWNVNTGEQLAELKGHHNWVFSIAFSPDASTLASGSYDKTVKLWNIADSKEIATLIGHQAGVRSVAFTSDGHRLISGSTDHTAIVWNLENRERLTTLKGHTAAIRAVACSPDDSTVATASEDATVKLWKTSDWTERASMAGAEGVMFWCLSFSPAGRTLAAGAFDGSVKLYDPSDGKERKTLRGATDAITAIAFAPDAHEIIAGSVDKSLQRWKADTGSPGGTTSKMGNREKSIELKPIEAVTALNAIVLNVEQPILSLSFSRDGKWLAVGTGGYRVAGSLQLWDLDKRLRVWKTGDFKYGVPAVSFANDDQRLAIGSFDDNFLRLFDASSGKQIKEIRGHRGKVAGIAYSPNGKLFATASLDRDIKLWDAVTNKELKTFNGHSDFVYSIAFSADGKRLLSGSSDRTARVWDIESGKEIAQLKGHLGSIQQAVFSGDGALIATASADGTARISNAVSGDYLLTLRGHRSKVDSVAFSPDRKLIATGSSDRTIRLWDPESGVELVKMSQEGPVRTVVFTPVGKYLATGCDDKSVKLWDVSRLRNREESAKETPSRG